MSQKLTTDRFPLSPLQQGMLFHYLREPHSGVDIEQLVIHLPEAIDASRLEAAWQWLALRHDILRARFLWEGVDQPWQEILPAVAVPFSVEVGRECSPEKQKMMLSAFLARDRSRGFDLDTAPLLRLTLFEWNASSFTLVWTFHHALLDGRCFPILLAEVFAAYAELATGRIAERSEPFPYRRYIEWLQQEDFTAAQEFWRRHLRGFTAPTPLMVDHKTPAQFVGYTQGEDWETLHAATSARLREFAESEALTMNTLVMAAWAVLLHRYSGESDVVFGATRACRKSSVPHAEETIGLFINTVPVRVQLDDEVSLASLLQAVRQQWIELRRFEHTPLALVKSASQLPAVQPLFDTLLVFEKYQLDTAMRSLGGDWANRRIELHELTNFPVTIAAYDGPELSFKIEFDRRRISAESAKRILGHLRCLLESMAANPEARVGDLILVNEGERRELVEKFNMPAAAPQSAILPMDGGATLDRAFEAQARRRPEAVALTSNGQSLTYAELNGLANRLARHLAGCGVGPDTLVGLSVERSNHLVVAILAILKAGGAYLPIDLAYPPERLRFILDDAQATVLLTERTLAANLPPTRAKVLCIEEILAEPTSADDAQNLDTPVTADHLAYVIYTSGTTGNPKGTLITHRNVTRLFASTEHWFGFNDRDVWTLFHSSAFDFSVWEIWGALLYGGRLVVVPFLVSRSPEAFYELLATEGVTVLNQTPSAFRQLVQVEASSTMAELALRYIIFGGEALEMQSLRPWFLRHGDRKPLLVNMYGITETTVHVTYRPLSSGDLESGSVIGVPIPDLQVYILDSQRRPVPIGVPGEMYVGGAGLARGYLRRPELTAQKFVTDHLTGRDQARLYRTGDLARFLPGREIEYLGRIDDQVKIRGFRIELGEIESVLCQHPAIREASVMAREAAPGIKQLIAYLVTSEARPELAELREHLKRKLPDYMIPAAFVFLEAFPLTNNGKIDRKALPAPEPERPEVTSRYLAPRSAVEKRLAEIWSKVLRLEKVGVYDNFFELGGDSILSIQVIARARREGLKLTPTLLFENPTVAELSRLVDSAKSPDLGPEVVAGDLPLTPIQHWFFEQNLADAHHYNQAFLLEVSERLDVEILRKALQALERHHDALRLRFVRQQGRWRQWYSAADRPVLLDVVKTEHLSGERQSEAIEAAFRSAHRDFDLENGPTWRVVYIDRDQAPGRLLLVVHHLSVDGVSWAPLLEDLETAYRQLKEARSVQLPSKTASFKTWAESLEKIAASDSLRSEVSYWEGRFAGKDWSEAAFGSIADLASTEGQARTMVTFLSCEETSQLLQRLPAAHNTQVNDALLTALAAAWLRWTGSRSLFINLEGHGRENLFSDMDLSRTVGWFTSIFPVRLELPATGRWSPVEALQCVKEQLREIPQRGVGYGILRYLGQELRGIPEAPILFNYLGQFDRILADSRIFRLTTESSGPWHGSRQSRRYALEVNSMVVDGQLQIRWTHGPEADPARSVGMLADEFGRALRELIGQAPAQPVPTPAASDFPLARLGQAALDRLRAEQPDIEDVYPLSPTQALYYSANPATMHSAFDQWQCTLEGELDVAAFQRAWQETVNRHAILRTSLSTDGPDEPHQVVRKRVELTWNLEDCRALPALEMDSHWNQFLQRDRLAPLDLSRAPMMRFSLLRFARDRAKFAWSVPALLLDGWSWPLVFRDVSRIYGALARNSAPELDPAPPYRRYLDWLNSRALDDSKSFWRDMLADFREPTELPSEAAGARDQERFVRYSIEIAPQTFEALRVAARRLQMTLNSVLQAAWALQLSRQSNRSEVVFGSAFSGRPAELEDAESIVGPFVNTLPVRVALDPGDTTALFLQQVHKLLLRMAAHQFTSLLDIQSQSGVPEHRRLFDSLVVFQNYRIDDASKSLGGQVKISDFAGPIHTNYPLLFLVEPQESLRLSLIYDAQLFARATVERWGDDIAKLLDNIATSLEMPVAELQSMLSPSLGAEHRRSRPPGTESQTFVPAESRSELAIGTVWARMFGLERVSVEENFFDLGGHSLLLVKMHRRLQEVLGRQFSIVTLFEHPTVRSLARHLDQVGESPERTVAVELQNRARRQREALEQMRGRLKKSGS